MNKLFKLILIGFIAGFLATVIFHQGLLELFFRLGIISFNKAYSIKPTYPFGIPAFISSSFWGGIWGIIGLFVFRNYITKKRFFLLFSIFDGIFPPLIYCVVVVPVKHIDPSTIFYPKRLLLMFIINFIFGFGTALIIKILYKISNLFKQS